MRKINLRAFTLIELMLVLAAIFVGVIAIYYVYDSTVKSYKVNSTVDQIVEINNNMSNLRVLNIDTASAQAELLKNKKIGIPVRNNNEFMNEWKGRITLTERPSNSQFYNINYFNVPKGECASIISNTRNLYKKVENISGKTVETNDLPKVLELCADIERRGAADAIVFSNFHIGNGAFDGSVSMSTSTSTSISSSISNSVSNSISTSGSVSRSNSISTSNSISNSLSNSVSASNSISRSNSISASNSVSNSISNSISASNSASTSRSNSISTSNSVSNSISASNSISNSVSASNSISRSNSISASTSNSVSNSLSTSTSISRSNSISASTSISNSISVSNSISTSVSNSNSGAADVNKPFDINKIKEKQEYVERCYTDACNYDYKIYFSPNVYFTFYEHGVPDTSDPGDASFAVRKIKNAKTINEVYDILKMLNYNSGSYYWSNNLATKSSDAYNTICNANKKACITK